MKVLVPEQINEQREYDADNHHRGNGYEYLAVVSLDPDVAGQFAKPVYSPGSELKQYAQYNQYYACDDQPSRHNGDLMPDVGNRPGL